MKRILMLVSVLLVALPATAQASSYDWESGCFSVPMVQRCWATNFTPNSGTYGNQRRTDNLHSLPTWNGVFSYGATTLNNSTDEAAPIVGGDYARGGGNIANQTGCTPWYSPTVPCNWSPSQFVTQNYVDGNGAWHFAMGGANQCKTSDWGTVCNLRHEMRPYDCLIDMGPPCGAVGRQTKPFSWGFPSNMAFEMSTNLYIGGFSGYWHAFLCVNLFNNYDSRSLELCEEPWNSGVGGTAHYPANGNMKCNGTSATLWMPAGTSASNPYMTTLSPSTTSHGGPGTSLFVKWRMTRTQFIQLLYRVAGPITPDPSTTGCATPLSDHIDDWAIDHSQNGMETFQPYPGGQPAGSGINWMMSDETMKTQY